jgi:hypothetical protein
MKNRKFLLSLVGMLVVAGTTFIAAPAAQAYDGYYGTWKLTAWELDGKIINCPGKLPLPPTAPAIECKGGETLKLMSDNTYNSTLDVIRMESHGGEFKVIKFKTNKYRTIIFQSYDVKDEPSPYRVNFQDKTSAGNYKKMTVSTSISMGPGEKTPIAMIFGRNAK